MSFWAKKLGPGAGEQQRGISPQRSSIPAHLLPQGLSRPQQPSYAPAMPQPPAAPYEGWQPSADPHWVGEMLPIWQWQGNPRGGAAETELCPDCGSSNYFSRASEAKINQYGQRVLPAPECFNCGYPRQQLALGPAAVSGAAQASRQGQAPAAPPGSVGTLSSSQ